MHHLFCLDQLNAQNHATADRSGIKKRKKKLKKNKYLLTKCLFKLCVFYITIIMFAFLSFPTPLPPTSKQTKKLSRTDPPADYPFFGRLCSTILPWYALHTELKVLDEWCFRPHSLSFSHYYSFSLLAHLRSLKVPQTILLLFFSLLLT